MSLPSPTVPNPGSQDPAGDGIMLVGELCKMCRGLNLEKMLKPVRIEPFDNEIYGTVIHRRRPEVKHHQSFAALSSAVDSGCELCAALKQLVLASTCQRFSCTSEEAEEIRREIDIERKRAQRVFQACFQGQVVETGSPGRMRFLEHFWYSWEGLIVPATVPDWGDTVYIYLSGVPGKFSSPDDFIGLSLQHSRFQTLSRAKLSVWGGMPIPGPVDLSVARRWLEECLQAHEDCLKPSHTELPSRILDLEAFSDTAHVRLTEGAPRIGQYATLSHCWGNSQPLKLTKASERDLTSQIVFQSLPRTSQTRSLPPVAWAYGTCG